MKRYCNVLLLLVFFLVVSGRICAETNQQEQPEKVETAPLYQKPTMKNFSKLYWALDRLDLGNDVYIDNFTLINECDIFRDYFSHEFEWLDVRKSTRAFLIENKDNFSLRLKFVQPLKLGPYHLENGEFEVLDEYKSDNLRVFEMQSSEIYDAICGYEGFIEGYPRSLAIEFSRPFALTSFPVERKKADQYITKKLESFRKLSERGQHQESLYDRRDAYIVMKVKIFASAEYSRNVYNWAMAGVMGVLEKIEIYSDRELTDLLYEQNYRKKKRRSKLEQELIDQYKQQKQEEQEQVPVSQENSE